MKAYCFIVALVIMFIAPFSSHAETFCVSDTTELQDALTTASSNDEDDTVQIEQGTYVGNFIYASLEEYDLTIEGGYTSGCGSRVVDPANTVLDGAGAGSVLVFSTPDTSANLEVDGLTLQNGVAGNEYGGGIYAKNIGDITISNSIIRENEAHDYGGGVYADSYGSSTLITFNNNIISGNKTIWGSGGGIHAFSGIGTIIFANNIIIGNSSGSYGSGGGICTGGSGNITFINNIISGNKDYYWGGGGISGVTFSGTFTLINNTISGNTAIEFGGGVYLKLNYNDAITEIINNIVWNNTVIASYGLGNDFYIDNDGNDDYFPSTVNLYNNNFDRSSAGTYIQLPFSFDSSNLDNEDPLFVDDTNGDYHLTGSSPCIDAGRLEGALSDDMEGEERPFNDAFDIGADEYVDTDGDGVPDYCDDCTDTDDDGYGNPGFPNNTCDIDNCPDDANPNQEDVDVDETGDACDNCPDIFNTDQSDADVDEIGDICDNCFEDYNPSQEDSDGDTVGNVCDNCPNDYNPNQEDADGDDIGDVCDNCPDVENEDQINSDSDSYGDACDNCPHVENEDQVDSDGDTFGDACDNTFCVSDATELQNTITTASSNGKNDTIQIVQGTYYYSEFFCRQSN